MPENEDGMILEAKDGTAQFRVSGGFVLDDEETTLRDSFNGVVKAVEEKGEYPSSDIGEDYWQVVWREKGESLHIRKFVLKKGAGVWAEIEVHYAASEGDVHPFANVIDHSIDSLVFAEG